MDRNFLPFRQRIGSLSESLSSIISETKSSVSTFLDDAKSFKESSLGFFSGEDRDSEKSQGLFRFNLKSNRCLNEKGDGSEPGRKNSCVQSCSGESSCSRGEKVALLTLISVPDDMCISSSASRNKDAGIQARYQPMLSVGASNRNKCKEWMSKIPEEATPKTKVRISKSEFDMSRATRSNGERVHDKHLNGTPFLKANSDLGHRFAGQHCFDYGTGDESENFRTGLCSMSTEEGTDTYRAEIEKAVIKVLDEIDEKTLEQMHQIEIPERNLQKNSGQDSCKNALSIVPECEQYFKKSPYFTKKFTTSTRQMPQLEKKYINIKTDMFQKSAKALDNVVGEMHISIQCLIVTEQLKVTINNVCSLQQQGKKKNKCSIFIDVSLVSNTNGNQAKRTKAHRRDETITYNHDMYFKEVQIENVHLLCLRFGVYKKSALFPMKQHKCIGECFVYLDDLDVVRKVDFTEKLIACN